MIGQLLNWLKMFFVGIFNRASELLGNLFQGLIDFLKLLLRPVFVVVALVFYFVYKVAELALTLIQVFLAMGKLLLSFVKGIFVTLGGFTYTASPRSDGQWSPIFANVVDGLSFYQLDTLSYVLLFMVWFATGFAAIRIFGSMRNGGD